MLGGALRKIPLFRLLAIAEVALLAQRHVQLLEPSDRRRFATLAKRGLRDRHLAPADREELARLVRILEPRAFAGGAIQKLSPVRLPRRLLFGRKKPRG